MVLFVDLEGDDDEDYPSLDHDHAIHVARLQKLRLEESRTASHHALTQVGHDQAEHISYNGFSAVLSCYPFALALARHLDLNDLYALSLTSKSIHNCLIQFRNNLITHSLRCSNDSNPLLIDLISRNGLTISDVVRTAENVQYGSVPVVLNALSASTLASTSRQATQPVHQNIGKLRHCARDLVAPCRKCGIIVCRNCTAKPPSDRCLKDRFRRICASCLDAPLATHLIPQSTDKDTCETPPRSSTSSTRSTRSSSNKSVSSMSTSTPDDPRPLAFTYEAFLHGPCTCSAPAHGTYLCTPCGSNLRASDTTYKRVWTWRSRYSTHIGGGLGTGLGEGDQGQKCGRGSGCLEAGKEGKGMCWVEIDCSEGTAEADQEENEEGVAGGAGDLLREHEMHAIGFDAPNDSRPSTPRVDHGPGYLRQEVEGLGGVMKKKVKKRVKVGATVWEYDDERESGKYLEREASGEQRSWCGWCSRVVLGREDRENNPSLVK